MRIAGRRSISRSPRNASPARGGIPAWIPVLLVALLAHGAAAPTLAQQQARFSIDDVLSPGFPLDLVSAREVDRIAWVEYERGMRNIYTAAAPAFAPERLTAFLRDDGHDLSGTQISADGSVVAFIRGHAANRSGWVANPLSDPRGAERAVWAVSSRGGDPWRVAAANSFVLSPDGRWVLFTRDGQIHRAAVNPGLESAERADDLQPLFRAWGDNEDPVWSPDGTRVAFVSDRDTHSFIGIYDTRDPRVWYLTPAVDRDVSPTWSPDGRRIAFIRRPGRPFGQAAERPRELPDSVWPDGLLEARFSNGSSTSIWIADVETGEGYELWHNTPEDTRFSAVQRIEWAGEHLVFQAEPENWRHWFSISTKDPERDPELLTPGEGEVEHVSISKDGRYLYYAANIGDIDRRHLWRVRTDGGRAEQLTRGDEAVTYPAALASGAQVAALYADARQPQSVAVVDADGGTPQVLKAPPPQFPMDQHVIPENVVLTADDGLEFHNQLFLPPNLGPGERRPALVFIHGGPSRQMLLGYHYMHFYHMAYAMNQYFANKGYVVLSVNYRRGVGYGREFRTAPRTGGQGNEEYLDILAAGRYLQGRADVDVSRIGLWGLSYGGILTAQGLARNSDIFAAGVDIAGVHLWGNDLDPESTSYRASSVSEVRNWTSPVLLVHGDDDRNVAFSQTVGLVQLLRANQVPFELIVFPDEVHDFLVHERWIRTFEATDDFFLRTMIRGEAVRVAGGGSP
jgi:dipeptidyl aminopeptidase/acylaminoacyl peptidase